MRWLRILVQLAMGAWFIYSGGYKIFVSGLDRFTVDIANYRLVAAPWDAVAAYVVPWVEVIAGGGLILPIFRRGAIVILAGMVGVFAVCIAWAWYQQLDISCGCHGSDAPIHYWGKVAEFVGYWLALGWFWQADRRALAGAGATSQ